MSRKMTFLLIIFCAVMFICAAPTRAGMEIYFDVEQTELSYDATSQTGSIYTTSDSTVIAQWILNPAGDDDVTIYNAFEIGGGGSFTAGINNLVFSQSGVNWSATGDLYVTDTAATKLAGDFFTTGIGIEQVGSSYDLHMTGYILPVSGNEAVLVGAAAGSPWTFQGEADSTSLVGGGWDGTDNQVTADPWEGFDYGTVVILHYSIGDISDLTTFFGITDVYERGDLEIRVVPLPAAVLLGMLGLGVAGIKLRKYA